MLNLKMSLCAWWPIFFLLSQKTVLFKSYFKSFVYSKQNAAVLRFEIFCGIKLSVTPVFTALILLLFFQIIKIRQCCGFTFTIFFLFLTAINVNAIFQTLKYFLRFSYFNRKIKTQLKTIANQNISFINVTVCY